MLNAVASAKNSMEVSSSVKRRVFRSKSVIVELLREQQQSGLSIQAFCSQHSIPSGSFHNWRKKYSGSGNEASEPAFVLLTSSAGLSHLKLLVYEQGGFTIFYRRLEQGAFEVPVFDLDAKSLQLTSDQLHFILQGISLQTIRYRKRYQQPAVRG